MSPSPGPSNWTDTTRSVGISRGEEAERDETSLRDRRRAEESEQEQERYNEPHPSDVPPQRLDDDGHDKTELDQEKPITHAPEWLTTLGTLGGLAFFTIWGVLGRLGLTALGTYNGNSVFPLIWAQMVGCAVMGALVGHKKELEDFSIPFYASLTTGFCGSMTTFSSFSLQVFQGFSGRSAGNHGGFYNAVDGVSITAITFGMMAAGLRLGEHTAGIYMRTFRYSRFSLAPDRDRITREKALGPGGLQRLSDPKAFLILLLGAGFFFWLGAALLAGLGPHYWRGRATFAIVFGPLGTFLRFYLARLNPKIESFPIGTFAANMFATALIGLFVLFQSHSHASADETSCAILQGLDDGFNGSLSTISTFAVELRALKLSHSYRYAILSWICGQVLLVLLYGTPVWVTGNDSMCGY